MPDVPFSRSQRLALVFVPRLVAWTIRLVGSTLRYNDLLAPETALGHLIPGPTVFVFWHRSLLVCAHRFRDLGIAILISRSFDGELIARTVELLGFRAVRGSSTRGGSIALRQMAQAYGEGRRCAMTADGPKGPAMVAKPGAVQLAELVGAEWIGAFSAVPDRCWTLKSWDRFMVPKPFAHVTMTWPAHVKPERQAVQAALDAAVTMAGGRR